MTSLTVVKLLHLTGFVGCLIASAMKNRLLAPPAIDRNAITTLRQLDRMSGMSTGVIILSGLAMAIWLAKTPEYFSFSRLFWAKIALFVAVSTLVLMTKIRFRKALATAQEMWPVPSHVRHFLRIDLVGLIALAVAGRLVAHGSLY